MLRRVTSIDSFAPVSPTVRRCPPELETIFEKIGEKQLIVRLFRIAADCGVISEDNRLKGDLKFDELSLDSPSELQQEAEKTPGSIHWQYSDQGIYLHFRIANGLDVFNQGFYYISEKDETKSCTQNIPQFFIDRQDEKLFDRIERKFRPLLIQKPIEFDGNKIYSLT